MAEKSVIYKFELNAEEFARVQTGLTMLKVSLARQVTSRQSTPQVAAVFQAEADQVAAVQVRMSNVKGV